MRCTSGWLLIALLTGGCSTTPIQPQIQAFSQSVETSTASALARYESEDIASAYRSEYHAAMASQDAFYELEGCGKSLSLSIALDDPKLADFEKHCALMVLAFDREKGIYGAATIIPPDDGPGVDGVNARRMALALGAYAKGLAELATANTPQEVGEKFFNATASLQNLGNEVASAKGGMAPETEALIGAGAAFVQPILTEVLEARRYRLLKQIVTAADPAVEISARALAAWYYKSEIGPIGDLYKELHTATAAAQEAAIAQAPGRAGQLAGVRTTYDALVEAETNAAWRVFLGVAESHRAILTALDAPSNVEQLMAANRRISHLAEQTYAFVKAVEAHKQRPKE